MVGFRVLRSFSVILLACLTACLPSFAQTITGDISGNVTDSSGAVLPSVSIAVQSIATGLKRTTTTTADGNFRIPQLEIGPYRVSASMEGFKTSLETVQVLSGGVIQVSIKLQLGQRAETVEVEGAAPLIELSPNNNSYVDSVKIEDVPLNGRDFNSLLALMPGVQRTPGGGFQSININGSRSESNNYFIDGLYNNDRYYGEPVVGEAGVLGIPAVLFPPEAMEELSIQGNPSAEFGVKGGAPISINMKSGTNVWHGSGTWVNHNGLGDAVNYFSKSNTDNCATAGECQATPIHNNQFNGTVGGPLIRDKAFLFLYYEGQRYKSLSVSSRMVPTPMQVSDAEAAITAAGLTPNPVGQALLNYFPTNPTGRFPARIPAKASQNSFGLKNDFRINTKNSVAFRYIFGDSLQNVPSAFGLPAAGNHPADLFNSVAASRTQLAGLSWSWNISNNSILESRLGYTRFAQLLGVNNRVNPKSIGKEIDPNSLGIDTGPLSPADFGVPYVYLQPLGYGGYIGGVQGYPLTTRPDATWDWSEHLSWVKGNHNFRFGGNFQRAYTNSLRNNARSGFTAAGYYPTGGDPTTNAIIELLLGKVDSANRTFGDTHRHIIQNSVGFYGQDDWKITPHFTLTYGLRWDINGAIGDTHNLESNFIPGTSAGFLQVGHGIDRLYNLDLHDFGPRGGFAWDIFGNSKVALRGGYSLAYDVPNFGAIAATHSFAGAHVGAFTQPDLGVFSTSLTGQVVSSNPPFNGSCYDPAAGVGDYICLSAGPIFGASPTGTPPFNAFSMVRNFTTPHYHDFNLSIQDELFRNNVFTLGYAGQRGRKLIIYRDLNATPLNSMDAGGKPCSATNCQDQRPFTTEYPSLNLEHVVQLTNLGSSQYDSLEASYNQRDWHGFDTAYNLTWSKCFDENSTNRGAAGNYPQLNNPLSVKDNRGVCDHDVRLNFNVSGVYALPSLPHSGRYLGKGWQLSTIYTAIGGRPFTVFAGGISDLSGQGLDGSSIRGAWDGTAVHYNTRNPNNYVVETLTAEDQNDPCGRNGGPDPKNPNHRLGLLPLSPFYIPCQGTVGTSRRNQLRGPGLSQWDVTLFKDTKVGEHLTVQLRWEVYNILNRANFFYLPTNSLIGAGFGTVTQTSDVSVGNPVIAQGGPRNMNFALKLSF